MSALERLVGRSDEAEGAKWEGDGSETTVERLARAYREEGIERTAKRAIEKGALQRLRDANPELYWRIAPAFHRHVYTRDVDAYDASPDPFKIERVDPARITRSSVREYHAWEGKVRLFGAVEDGDWDRPRPDHRGIEAAPNPSWGEDMLFENKGTYRMFEQRFVHGADWEEIDLIQQRLEEASEGIESWQGCSSPEEIREQCRFLDELYEEFRTDGFSSQRELHERDRQRYEGFLDRMGQEVLVDVGRTGELLHVAGDHRLSMAKLLDLDEVPVAFLVRHAGWMEYRDRLYENGTVPNHPDLRDLQ
ncbi:hypothetical protein [Halalkalicoccus tibetensis]|uniref:ParB-like nuclease domain-containing protein n=1 Tax=Halalkalicoccus tibetensis TaxID=175632 RepID=A0ABD5V2K8_9EURY